MNCYPVIEFIHKTNYTHTTRVCNINNNHLANGYGINELKMNSNGIFSDLNPGLYCIEIDGIVYYFDLYIPVDFEDTLCIKNPFNVYATFGYKKYPILLYKMVDNNDNNNVSINNTVNDAFDMIVINGKTSTIPSNYYNIQNLFAIKPNNNTFLSTRQLLNSKYNMDEISSSNTIINNIACTNEDYYGESTSSNKPCDIRSISGFKIITSKESINDEDNYLDIYLKNNVKSLPNGIKDTFILNSELQEHHIVYRIGRKVFTGNEDWKFIEDNSTDDYYLYWLSDNNVLSEDSDNNLNCTHFENIQSSKLFEKDINKMGISTGFGDIFTNGFFIRVQKDIMEPDPNDKEVTFKNWLRHQIESGIPLIVEYPLNSFKYKTVLIDEYHINTYFNKTNIKINNDYDVSYFYKIYHT